MYVLDSGLQIATSHIHLSTLSSTCTHTNLIPCHESRQLKSEKETSNEQWLACSSLFCYCIRDLWLAKNANRPMYKCINYNDSFNPAPYQATSWQASANAHTMHVFIYTIYYQLSYKYGGNMWRP